MSEEVNEKTLLAREELAGHYKSIINLLGEDVDREGLLKTPERVAKAMQFLTKGYHEDPAAVLRGAMFKEEDYINLDTFISSYCQAAIYNLKSGMPLQLKANGCTDFHGNEILRFSRKFQNTLEELDKKGYRLKEAAVNFVVYWERRKDKQEVKIVLPKIIVEKNTD